MGLWIFELFSFSYLNYTNCSNAVHKATRVAGVEEHDKNQCQDKPSQPLPAQS